MKTYRISELAEKLGVSRRTVHYYLARRLLPSPQGSGLATLYTEEHYFRILLIKKWQGAFLPLEEIRRKLLPLTLSEVREALDEVFVVEHSLLNQDPPIGESYERIKLDQEIELHVNTKNKRAREQALEIINWWQHYKKEG